MLTYKGRGKGDRTRKTIFDKFQAYTFKLQS